MILSDEQAQIRDAARTFARERLLPFAAQWDRDHAYPTEAIREMAELGFFGMVVPEEWGGSATGQVAYALALEEIAAGDGACSTIMSVHNSVGVHADPELRHARSRRSASCVRWHPASGSAAFALTEPQAGSDAANLSTRARREGDSLRARRHQAVHHLGATADVRHRLRRDRSGGGQEGHLGLRRSDGHARLQGLAGRGEDGPARLRHLPDHVRRAASSRPSTVWARRARAIASRSPTSKADASASPRSRSAWRGRRFEVGARLRAGARDLRARPIIEHQAVAFRLADMATQIEAARQMVLHAAALREAGQPCLTEASMAKLFASEMAETVCSDGHPDPGRLRLPRGFSGRAHLSRRAGLPDLRGHQRHPAPGHRPQPRVGRTGFDNRA